ncbi:hypothetical protein [Streptomyces sp. NBC_01236]|uniref:hypothetical protein n=1 Tax=Streptomyces sp. NBC_01236 TaxID=2903789 RepID=UPI002E122EF6|nr:hypothetical protein OG324_44155 [Streptomyces sp. NBC_01236]
MPTELWLTWLNDETVIARFEANPLADSMLAMAGAQSAQQSTDHSAQPTSRAPPPAAPSRRTCSPTNSPTA